jgi:hypothetical protein
VGEKMKKTLFYEVFEDEGVYSEETREMLLDGDELSPEEEAFMRGYDEAG